MTRVKRSAAFLKPSFWHCFNPQFDELVKLVSEQQSLLAQEMGHQNDSAAFAVKKTQLPHNVQNAGLLERESQHLIMEGERIRRNKIISEAKLNNIAERVGSLHREMVADLTFEEGLSQERYLQFLSSFKSLLSSTVNLPCFSTPAYEEIKIAIKTNMPN